MKLSDCLHAIGKPFSYYPNLAIALGSVKASVLLCYLVWRDKNFKDGSTEKTESEIQKETGLGPKEVKSAKELLVESGVLSINYKRMYHVSEMTVNFDRLEEILTSKPDTTLETKARSETAHAKTDHALVSSSERDDGQVPNRHVAPSETELRSLPIENKRENKTDTLQLDTTSPQSGEDFSNSAKNIPQYDFGTFKSFYPQHRMWKNERAARDEWNPLSPRDHMAIIEHLSVMGRHKDWTNDGGKYVPRPQKYLAERYWEHTGPALRNHREECERIHGMFLELAEMDVAYCKLTEARKDMLSQRWDDALEKAEGNDARNALSAIRKAIKACVESHFERRVPKNLTLEAIFKTTEDFEKWLILAYDNEAKKGV